MTVPAIAPENSAADTRAMVSSLLVLQDPVQLADEVAKRRVLTEQPHDDRVVLQGPDPAAAAHRHFDHLGQQHLAGLHWIRFGLRGLQRVLQLGQLQFGDGDDDLVLGLELVVDRGFRDADGVGDHLQRGSADPVIGDQIQRGVENTGLRRGAGGGAQPRSANTSSPLLHGLSVAGDQMLEVSAGLDGVPACRALGALLVVGGVGPERRSGRPDRAV